MIAMNREDGDCYIDVRIFVVDMIEIAKKCQRAVVKAACDLTYASKCSVGSLSISSSQGLSP